MESISKKGKVFTGKFAETAVKLGLAEEVKEEVKPKAKRKPKAKK